MVQYKLKPQPSDKRNVSQGDILNNFTYLQTSVGNDHNFTNDSTATNDGLHKQSTYFVSPDPTTSATQVAVYCKNDGAGVPQVWERPLSNGTPIQLTATSTTGGTVPAINAGTRTGVTFLPGGFLLQWGFTQNGTNATTFPVQFGAGWLPVVTFSVTNSNFTGPIISSTAPTATGFQVLQTPGGVVNIPYTWHAIGPA